MSASAMGIRPAQEPEAQALTSLALRAKAHWGYPAEAIDGWRQQLAISPEQIRANPTFVAFVDATIAGFYSLRASGPAWELDNLWVLPEYMHRGIGRALLSHALLTAAQRGAERVVVDADPNAEAFYLHCGAVRRGSVPAPIRGQPNRQRPQLAFDALPAVSSAADCR